MCLIARCRKEIAAIEAQIRAGHPDLQGLCLALADWSAELRLLQASGALATGAPRLAHVAFLRSVSRASRFGRFFYVSQPSAFVASGCKYTKRRTRSCIATPDDFRAGGRGVERGAPMYRIVYFIGAGLTKSLETCDCPVPMMWDFVSTMAHYLDDPAVLATMVDLERADLYEWKSADAAKLAEPPFPPDRAAFKQALKNRPAAHLS
jgi:hypothetical protein